MANYTIVEKLWMNDGDRIDFDSDAELVIVQKPWGKCFAAELANCTSRVQHEAVLEIRRRRQKIEEDRAIFLRRRDIAGIFTEFDQAKNLPDYWGNLGGTGNRWVSYRNHRDSLESLGFDGAEEL